MVDREGGGDSGAGPRIVVVGLGAMGAPIARRLHQAGHAAVRVHDRDPEAVQRLARDGIGSIDALADVAAFADVVVCMLPHPDILAELMLEPAGLARHLRPGSLVIDMATDGPAVVEQLADAVTGQDVSIVDAPVGRGPKAARAGELLVFLGGKPDDRDRAAATLAPVAAEFVHCGPLGSGQALKLANNFVQSANIAVLAEAVSIAQAAGVPIDTLAQVMSKTAANSFQLNNGLIGKALKMDYSPIMRLDLTKKDMTLAARLAAELDVDVPCGNAVLSWFERASAAGLGELDQTALFQLAGSQLAEGS